jgi:hypothetical protein
MIRRGKDSLCDDTAKNKHSGASIVEIRSYISVCRVIDFPLVIFEGKEPACNL